MKAGDKQQKRQGKQYGFFSVLLAFFVISFLGWAYETLLMLIWHGKWYDRGFLSLPFCPIYGFPVCGLYLLFGAPHQGRYARFINRKLRKWPIVCREILRYIGYFLLSGGLATAVELIVGLCCERVGISLWSYQSEPFNYRGHICLWVSLFWGVLLTFLMRFAFLPLLRLLSKVGKRATVVIVVICTVALTIDFIYNLFLYFS